MGEEQQTGQSAGQEAKVVRPVEPNIGKLISMLEKSDIQSRDLTVQEKVPFYRAIANLICVEEHDRVGQLLACGMSFRETQELEISGRTQDLANALGGRWLQDVNSRNGLLEKLKKIAGVDLNTHEQYQNTYNQVFLKAINSIFLATVDDLIANLKAYNLPITAPIPGKFAVILAPVLSPVESERLAQLQSWGFKSADSLDKGGSQKLAAGEICKFFNGTSSLDLVDILVKIKKDLDVRLKAAAPPETVVAQ